MKQDLMESFQEIIYQKKKNKGLSICNKFWWIYRCRHAWIALCCSRSEIVYFNSFGVEHIPEEIKEFVGNKNIKANIFRVQANTSVRCGYFCIGFIDYMLTDKKLTDFTDLFSLHGFKKNDSTILSYFKDEWNW